MSRSELVRTLSPHARASTPIGTALLLSDILQYALAIAGVLFLSPILAKLACGIYAGVRLGSLLILAHDAAHQCLVSGRRLNKLLAVVAFCMGLHNYRLWIIDHHGFHHPNTNGGHKGTYTPFALDVFQSLPRWRQQVERFYRSGNPLGLAAHYLKERWLHALFVPNALICPKKADRVSAWRHAAIVIGYAAAWLLAMMLAPQYSATSAV
jgi:omega-6 fatty acid desaturase (delta-12 desaturase)